MKKTIFVSKNLRINLNEWRKCSLQTVEGGLGCIMGVTEDGFVLQKMINQKPIIQFDAVPYESEILDKSIWCDVKSIAVSKCIPGLTMGLTHSGKCIIRTSPFKSFCSDSGISIELLEDTVNKWRDICEIAVSDAFFARDSRGKVYHCPLNQNDNEYIETSSWFDVQHISAGASGHSIFGITRDGRILSTGKNIDGTRYTTDIRDILFGMRNVVDVCMIGSSLIVMEDEEGSYCCLQQGYFDRYETIEIEKIRVPDKKTKNMECSGTEEYLIRQKEDTLRFWSPHYPVNGTEIIKLDGVITSFSLGYRFGFDSSPIIDDVPYVIGLYEGRLRNG